MISGKTRRALDNLKILDYTMVLDLVNVHRQVKFHPRVKELRKTAMALNILELLKHEFSDEIVGQLGKFVNEDTAKTKSALATIFPALLGGLVSKGSTHQGATEVLNMITKGGYGADSLKSLSTAFMGGDSTNNLLNSGSALLEGIFGDRITRVIEWVSNSSGIGKSSAYSLLGLVAPAVLGLLGKEVKNSNMNPSGMMNLLAGQAEFIKNQAPAGLADVLGLSNLSDLSKSGSVPSPSRSSLWKMIIPLIIIVGLVLFLSKTCSTPQVKETSEMAPEQAVEEMAPAIGTLGEFMAVKLPNGVELNVPEFGIERKLIAFIEDTSKPIDETTWFTFDRLEFETGSATLMPTSAEQLNNIAEIMRAYPQVNMKIGGYTDNTGGPEANLSLSQERANTTMSELVVLGVEAARLQAEGYGENFPVADNATEEGRQKNRRIDIKVTSK